VYNKNEKRSCYLLFLGLPDILYKKQLQTLYTICIGTGMPKPLHYDLNQYPRILLVMVHAPYNKISNIHSYFDEFTHLVESNNIPFIDTITFRLRDIDPSTFLTEGHVETLAKQCEELSIDEIIISEPLTGNQERHLTDAINAKVFDRTQLILEIFEKSAKTAEGKTQVAIAMLEHKKSRLAGKGIHLSQQKGTIGMRAGFGETQKEKETRHIKDTIKDLKKELEKLQQIRETQRKQRVLKQIPHICLVGYTNAGKSTILNSLTKADVLAEDRLFATLDTTTRELYIDHKKIGVISDTVGFIQMLPPQLIEAFKSTLSELYYADLLLHVVDTANPNWEYHITVVQRILHELDIDKPVVYVFNKIDKIDLNQAVQEQCSNYQPHVFINAQSRETMAPLLAYIQTWLSI
jgi:GTPase